MRTGPFQLREVKKAKRTLQGGVIDKRAFFEAFPTAETRHYLEPGIRRLSKHLKPNLIGPDGSLSTVFQKSGRTENIEGDTVTWRMYGQEGDVRSTIISVISEEQELGKGGDSFFLEIGDSVHEPGTVILIDGLRDYPLYIESVTPVGIGSYEYEFTIWDAQEGDVDFIEPRLLAPGTEIFGIIAAPMGEEAIHRPGFGVTAGHAFIEYEVPLSRNGYSKKITDKAQMAAKYFRIAPSRDSKDWGELVAKAKIDGHDLEEAFTPEVIVSNLDIWFARHMRRAEDLWHIYGRRSGQYESDYLDNLTRKGKPSMSPGLWAYMEQSTVIDTPTGANILSFIQARIAPLFNDKVDISDRRVDVYTGSAGLMRVQEDAKKLDLDVVYPPEFAFSMMEQGLEPGRKGYMAGAPQFRGYFLEPFGYVVFHHLPLLDSKLAERKHSDGFPIPSHDFIVFNYGYGNDENDSNVIMARNPDMEQYGYLQGTWTPLGAAYTNDGALRTRYQPHENPSANYFRVFGENASALIVRDTAAMIYFRAAIKR